MKFLLIEPKNKNFIHIWGKVYISKLTLPYISSYIPEEDDFTIIDENIEKLDFNSDADCILITTLTASSIRAYEIGDKFKKRGKIVVIGGIHASMLPDEAICHADTVVIGECENVITELIEDIKNKNLKKFYNSSGKANLGNYNKINRTLINENKYHFCSILETGRGCPFDCDFCSTTKFFGNKQRFRPIEEVIDEIKQTGYKWLFFTDDNITCNKKRARELFEALIPLNIHWTGQGSINIAGDDKMLKLMKKSGCRQLLVGFETLDPENINEFTGKKSVNIVEDYEKYIKAFHNNGIGLLGCFVFGFDNDDISVFDRTYNFIMRNNIDAVQLSILTPFPGTKLFYRLEEEKRIIHKDWSKYDIAHVTFKPKLMSPQELRTGYNKICNKIYSLSNIAKRCIRGFKYLKNLNHSFLAFPLINYTYRKLYSIGKTEQIWKYLNKDLPDLLFKKLIKIKSYFEENKKNIKNRNQDLNVHNLKKIYGKLARKIGRIEKYILRENIEKVSKKLKYCLAFINQKISKLKRYGKHDSALKQIEESKKIIKNLYSMII